MTSSAALLAEAPADPHEPTPVIATPHEVPPRTPAGALWTGTMVYAHRHLEHIRQIPEKILGFTVQPVMFVLLFAYVFGGAIGVGNGSFREYIVAGILVLSFAFGMTGPAVSIATDMNEGVIDRFRSLPVSRFSYLLGTYVAELTGMVLTGVCLFGTGYLVGWRPHSEPFDILRGVLLLVCFASASIWAGMFLGLVVRAPDAVMGIAFVVVFPVTFVSSAFVPVTTMPELLQTIASWNPVSVVVTAVRALFGNPTGELAQATWPLLHPVRGAFIGCMVVLAAAVPATVLRFRRRTIE